jgi:hypothetical protein
MARRPLPLRSGLALVLGLVLGWALAGRRPAGLLADGADRLGDSIVVSGPIGIKYNPQTRTPTPEEAVYYLHYPTGRLLVAVPTLRQTAAGTQVLSEFAERDLVKDFDLAPGSSPHFLMTTASLGALSDGLAPLFVFETTTGQVATYRVAGFPQPGTSARALELLERRTERRLTRSSGR